MPIIKKCSNLLGLDKLFTDPEEIVFLMSSFLNYVEKCVLKNDLCDFFELIVQNQVVVVRIIYFLFCCR